MPTVISHAVVGAALITAFPTRSVPRRLAILGGVCAMAPDIDVVGFRFGVHYGDLLGHRGLTHSLVFAAGLAFTAQFAAVRRIRPNLIRLYLFLATASHGSLDAFTNGGLGVAFFSPFQCALFLSNRADCCFTDRSTFLLGAWMGCLAERVSMGLASIDSFRRAGSFPAEPLRVAWLTQRVVQPL